GAGMIAGLHRLFGHRQRLLDRRGATLSTAQTLHELLDLALGHSTDKAIDRPPVLEGVNRGDRLDAHLLRDFGVLVDIELDHSNGAVGGANGLFEDRPELLAGTAPRRPEIDDNRRVERSVDDLGHKTGGSDVLYRGGSRAADQSFARHQSSLRLYPTTWRHSRCKTSGSRPMGSALRDIRLALEAGQIDDPRHMPRGGDQAQQIGGRNRRRA